MESAINVTVLRHKHKFPERCAHCFKAEQLIPKKIGYDPRKLKTDTKEADHPEDILPQIGFCQKCAKWQNRRKLTGAVVAVIGVVIAIALMVAFPFPLPHRVGGWVGAILIAIFCSPGIYILNLPDRNVQVFAFTDETITFSFKRTDYANQFMKLNKVSADTTEDSSNPAKA